METFSRLSWSDAATAAANSAKQNVRMSPTFACESRRTSEEKVDGLSSLMGGRGWNLVGLVTQTLEKNLEGESLASKPEGFSLNI